MSTHIDIDLSQFDAFFGRMSSAARGYFRKEFERFLEGVGYEFLRLVQDEIMRRNVMDTRNLLNSFYKDGKDNVWIMGSDGSTLEVGTNVEYAGYVEYGHNQEPGRFIPGYWQGDRFVYDRNAKGGMVLKANWVDGKHYFDGALRLMEELYPEMLEKKLTEWIDDFFGG